MQSVEHEVKKQMDKHKRSDESSRTKRGRNSRKYDSEKFRNVKCNCQGFGHWANSCPPEIVYKKVTSCLDFVVICARRVKGGEVK